MKTSKTCRLKTCNDNTGNCRWTREEKCLTHLWWPQLTRFWYTILISNPRLWYTPIQGNGQSSVKLNEVKVNEESIWRWKQILRYPSDRHCAVMNHFVMATVKSQKWRLQSNCHAVKEACSTRALLYWKKSRYDIDAQGIEYRNIWNLQTPRCRCCWNVVREPCEVYKLKVEVISIVRNLRESN